jgi:NAD(P)-dependent dehydrogenase (short-subunit alcohol dehydrogenase family)
VNVASIAAFDGQKGQAAYSASKAGVVGMCLPLARDLAWLGIRVVTVAPGIMGTRMLYDGPMELQEKLVAEHAFPKRPGRPEEFAALVAAVVENPLVNGETIRLDAAARLSPG